MKKRLHISTITIAKYALTITIAMLALAGIELKCGALYYSWTVIIPVAVGLFLFAALCVLAVRENVRTYKYKKELRELEKEYQYK